MKQFLVFLFFSLLSQGASAFLRPEDLSFKKAQRTLELLKQHPLAQDKASVFARHTRKKNGEPGHYRNKLNHYFPFVFGDFGPEGQMMRELHSLVGNRCTSFLSFLDNTHTWPYACAQGYLDYMKACVEKGEEGWTCAQDGPDFVKFMVEFLRCSRDAKQMFFAKLVQGNLSAHSGLVPLALDLNDPKHAEVKSFFEQAARCVDDIARVYLNKEELAQGEHVFVCPFKGAGGKKQTVLYIKGAVLSYKPSLDEESKSVATYTMLEQNGTGYQVLKKKFPFANVKEGVTKKGEPIMGVQFKRNPCLQLRVNMVVSQRSLQHLLRQEGDTDLDLTPADTPLSLYQQEINRKLSDVGDINRNCMLGVDMLYGCAPPEGCSRFSMGLVPEEKMGDPFVACAIETMIEEFNAEIFKKNQYWADFIELPHGMAYETLRLLCVAEGLAHKAREAVSERIQDLKAQKQEREEASQNRAGIVPSIVEIDEEGPELVASTEPSASCDLELQELESLELHLSEELADIKKQKEEAQQQYYSEWEAVRLRVSEGATPALVSNPKQKKKKKKTGFAQAQTLPTPQPKAAAKLTSEGTRACEKLKQEIETLAERKDLNRTVINRTIERITTMAQQQGRVECKSQEGSGGHNVITLKLDEAGAQKLGVKALKFDLMGHGAFYKRGTFLGSILPDVKRILALEPKHLLEEAH